MIIRVVNFSSPAHGISDNEAKKIVAAVHHQMQHDYGKHWHRDVHVEYVGKWSAVPVDAPVVLLQDWVNDAYTTGVPNGSGIIGIHDFGSFGSGRPDVPFAVVGVRDAAAAGAGWKFSEFVSHEILEMAARPRADYLTLSWTTSGPHWSPQRLHPVEIADACQRSGYDVVLASGDRVAVANFCLPNWFDNFTGHTKQTDFAGHLAGPFSLTYYGYMETLDVSSLGQDPAWTETDGPRSTGLARVPGAAEVHETGVETPPPEPAPAPAEAPVVVGEGGRLLLAPSGPRPLRGSGPAFTSAQE
jgi:hypothetical protein